MRIKRILDGRYELLELVGKGGLGTVYRAHDHEDGKTVAIKIVPPSDGAGQDRLMHEARVMAHLNIDGVPKWYASFMDRGMVHLVQEFIPGSPMDQWQKDRTEVEILSVYWQLANILHRLHQQGIVHRDLKADNVMVGEGEELPFVPRLLDLGLAVDPNSNDSLTGTGFVVGTVVYMAPEQLTGDPITDKADIYALGLMLYEALVGETPWPSRSPMKLMIAKVEHALPAEIHQRLSDLKGEGLVDLIPKMIHRNPEMRPSSEQVLDGLRTAYDSLT